MSGSAEQSPGEDYFNDLSQQPSNGEQDEQRRGSQDDNGPVPKPKRIACVLCRKRKLRCDGMKPSCGTCNRLQHDCSYDEVRRKSGPKRGYVKALEARLAQVETLLKTQDEPPKGRKQSNPNGQAAAIPQNSMAPDFADIVIGQSNVDMLPHIERTVLQHEGPAQAQFPHSMLGAAATGDMGLPSEETFPWEMIGLGLDEPLPNQDVIDELNQAFFDKIQPSLPMIHRPRYYAAMNLAPHMRPPICLRYAMWANAAAVTDKYEALQEHFYQRARKYIQQDEMKGHGESMITIAHCQTWALLAAYEFKLMYFPRAWMSSGRASRMALMMGLHRMDGAGLDVKQCLPPPKDWTEREERRRTYWMCFCTDRYSSIGTGWPMTMDEKDIKTNLPCDEESYELSRPVKTMTLEDSLKPDGTTKLGSFAGVILLASLFGRNLLHLHRPGPDDRDEDLNGEFWKRHRQMDNILLNTALALPDSLRLPVGLNDPNIVFLNMNIHTSTICLHQAAIFKADKNRMPSRISAESKVRCITAAAEIATIMRQISHLDLSSMNPFISFCLYVSARVFVQYLKSRPKDTQVRGSLQFLLSAMHAIKRKNPLTESFLVQLDVDLESAGLEDTNTLRATIPKRPAVPDRFEECPTNHLFQSNMDGGPQQFAQCGRPTYGDQGLAVYNEPNSNGSIVQALNESEPMNFSGADMTDYMSTTSQFELPNRQRTPGSMQGSNSYRSPNSLNNPEMDTSPDGSGDQRTPSSTTQSQQHASSHTSHTGYSPQNQQAPGITSNDSATFSGLFSTEFDMHSFPTTAADRQEPGFVLPQNWSGGSTGLTPGPTGMTPGSSMADIMGMTDADWSSVLNGFENGGWDAGVDPNVNMSEMMPGRRTN